MRTNTANGKRPRRPTALRQGCRECPTSFQYVHRCFYSENAPKVHNVPYCSREIFMSLTIVIEADEFERGCKQRRDWRTDLGEAALPDLALITARLHLRFVSSARRYCPCPRNRRAYLFLVHPR